MSDLIEFLRARLDEEEEAARKGTPFGAGRWFADGATIRDSEGGCVVHDDGEQDAATAEHIALHDPARVLADVDAKRRILDEHYPVDPCDACDASFESIPCATLRLLALPYVDHPDYRDEWRPA